MQRLVPSLPIQSFISFTEQTQSIGRRAGERVIGATRRHTSDPVAADLGVDKGTTVVEIVRLRLLDDASAMLERSAFPLGVGRVVLATDLDTESIYQTMRAHGVAPTRARHVFDAVAADALDSSVLGALRTNPLQRVRRVAWTAGGTLVEVADDRYLPTMVSFTVQNASDALSGLTRTAGENARATRASTPRGGRRPFPTTA